MTTEQITEALDACELGGGLAVSGACPTHGGDNCLHRYDRAQGDWVSCPTCNGSGVRRNHNRPDEDDYEPCPDCVGGLVPSPELIKRVGDTEVQNPEDGGGMALGDLIGGDRVLAALLASRQGDPA